MQPLQGAAVHQSPFPTGSVTLFNTFALLSGI